MASRIDLDRLIDWETGIFRGLRSLWRSVTPSTEAGVSAARLSDFERRLTVLAQVLSGESLRIRTAKNVGGLRGRDVLLPPFFDLATTVEANYELYVVRTALSAVLWRSGSAHCDEAGLLGWLETCREVLARTCETWSQFGEMHERAVLLELAARPAIESLTGRARVEEELRRAALAGEPLHQSWLDRLSRSRKRRSESPPIAIWGEPISFDAKGNEIEAAADAHEAADPSTEMDAHAFEDLRVLLLDEQDTKELPTHAFEQVQTLDTWDGAMRHMDGEDDLEDHAEALEALDLRDLVRGGEQAQSVYKADIAMDIAIPDVSRIKPDETGIPYDEWDYRKKRYRKNWAMVYPATVPLGGLAWAQRTEREHRRIIEDLFCRLYRHREQLRPANRQLDGDSVDLDALVDEHASMLAGHGGNQRLYVRQDRRQRDAATTVLIDISLSTDSYVEGRRVIDIAREAVLVLGIVSDRLADQLRVLAFASHTRNQVRVWDVKKRGERWEQGARRLALLQPQGYTRIGPAIRHAANDLAAVQARRRLLLLISDGKPSDFDRYEGRYGVADVRRAVREARGKGVAVHALAVEAMARDYLPGMLGAGAWHLLPHADKLPEVLTTIYGRLTT